ncbi:hypothetical protein BaRGS_00018372 [Batillaria attramentaria]|uniref:NADH dehydrogenase [ubiquinone] 1 alpha subcomplex assembly factor 2 n=1 Tax=Batillaria attramentaria TaxID=370345 RepID=A0ABD0KTQ7_9CAEN
MSRSAGLFARVWQGIRGAFGAREQAARFVGEDHLGNRYYEKDPDQKRGRRGSRWVEARDAAEGDMTFMPEVPSEWDSWLRRRRDNPPTQEELDRNYAMMIRTQQRAKELERNEGKLPVDEVPEAPYTETVTEESFKSKFPKYEDFEIAPGQFQEKQQKKGEK